MRKLNIAYKIIKFLISKSEYKFIKPADIIISTNDADKSYLYNNKFYSTILDSFVGYFKNDNYNLLAISVPGSKLYKKQTSFNYLNINRDYYLKKIKNYFSKKDELFFFWQNIFQIVKPKIILCIQPSHEMCAAAKKSNILIVDIQHGLINDLIYYNFKNPYGKKGLPNIVLCWDNISKNYLEKILPDITTFVIGNPWISKLGEKNSNKFISIENKKLKPYISNKPAIVVTLQWKKNFTKQVIDIPIHIIDCLNKLINKGWDCWLRFHPAHFEEFDRETLHDKWNKKTNLKINPYNTFDLSDVALPFLLRHANVHITNFSASIIEAKIMKVTSYIWCQDKNIKKKLLHEYLNSSYVKEASLKSDKLFKTLNRYRNKKKSSLNFSNLSKKKYEFFKNQYLKL